MNELEMQVDHYLEILQCQYHEDENYDLEKIVVNAKPDITYDDYYNRNLMLSLPKELYLNIRSKKTEIETKLFENYNQLIVESEHRISRLNITMSPSNKDWRDESGMLLSDNRMVAPSVEKRIWGDSPLHVFFSYTKSNFELVLNIKDELNKLGIFCFVAEKDIPASERWEKNIEEALISMHFMVVFLSGDYHESEWTDQEIGYAISKNIPIISVALGKEPYGFLSRFQAMKCDVGNLSNRLFNKLTDMDYEHGVELKINGAVYSLCNAKNYYEANKAAKILFQHKKISDKQVENIVNAYNSNNQVSGAHEIKNGNPPAIISYLNEVTGKEYHINYGILSIKE